MSQRNGPPKKKEPSFHNNPFKDAIKAIQKKAPEPEKPKQSEKTPGKEPAKQRERPAAK